VTTYLKEVPAGRQPSLKELCDSRDGVVEVGFASRKNYISLYILRTDVMRTHRYLLDILGVTLERAASALPGRRRSIARCWKEC
jgi:hypothetical protein